MTGPPWLSEAAEWVGHWWLPDDLENPQPGVLRYEPVGGLSLALIGGFEDRILRRVGPGAWDEMEESRSWEVILGIAENKEVTLLDCLPTKSKSYGLDLRGPAKQTIHVQTALVGVHLPSKDDRVFTACRASVEGLTAWSADSVLCMTMGLRDDQLDGRGTIEATPVEGHSARHCTTTLRLEHHHTMPHFERRRGSTLGRMTDSAILYVEPDEPNSLADLRRTTHAMQDLLSLATHRAAGVLWLTLGLPPEEHEECPSLPRDVSVYAEQRVAGDPLAKAPDHGVLFTANDLPFETVVPRWLEIRDRFAATVNLLLGLRYVPGGYLETQVSQAVTAAEAMHRALKVKAPIPEEEFKTLKDAVLSAVPDERKEWARNLLLRNEPSLKTRLLELASRPDDEAMTTLLPDAGRWVQMTVKARNDLTHSGQSSAHDLRDLHAISSVTTAVVLLNLLNEVGLSGEQQRTILSNNSELSTACRLSREYCSDQPVEGA